ncbi:hypothetical protein Glove_279g17 [Diversispora epigaea]|uniref:Neurochondrin n=1 Tax=Diversispora epigaea TaxID=1348612 RepID=A0A397I9C8_9GLOM|nr:hypothetical protein Glove_279g17 [Diversispora epigaea]
MKFILNFYVYILTIIKRWTDNDNQFRFLILIIHFKMNQELQSEFRRCLELLSPSSPDDAKFAALMLIPRFLQQDNEKGVILVFEAMDFKFLERLMRTENLTENNLPDYTLKSIAVHILSCFCVIEDLTKKKQLHARIPTLSMLLSPNKNEELTQEILKIFLKLVSVKQGLTHIVDSKTISHILQCIKNSTNVETRDIGLQVIHHTTMGVITSMSTDHNFSDQKIIQDYLFIMLSELSDIFRKNQDKLKFDVLEFFVQMFSYITDKLIQDMLQNDISRTNVWVQNIRYGLKDILKSKIGNENRDKALILIMQLSYHFGAIWLFTSNLTSNILTTSTTSTQNSNTEKEKIKEEFKFAALVVQLACIEIKLMLDELSDQLENNKNYEPIERHEIILPACYTILEKSIEYLTKVEYMLDFKKKGEFVDLVGVKLDPELLLRLKSTMIETFRIIMDHLLDIKNFTGSIESNSTLTDKAIASIRILSVWLAEEGSLEKEVITVIPFLLDFCRSSLNSQYTGVNLIKMLTPAFLNLTSQDKPLEMFCSHGGPEMIIDYFIKIWDHSKITNDIKDEIVDDLLGPLQVLLNIVVLKREDFITKYKVELMKVIIIGRKISEILVSKLKSTGYSSQGNQIILLANTLLLCLLIISGASPSSDLFEKDIVMSFINVATTFYEDQNCLSQNEIDVQVNELNLLGKQVLGSISSLETRDIGLQVIHHTTMGVITSMSTDHNFSDQKIIQDYLFIMLSELSDIFRKNQDKLKFDVLEFFVQMFSYITDKLIQDMLQNDISRTNVWVQNIRYGLKDILKSKIGNENRDKALILIMQLSYHFGAIWLFTSNLTSNILTTSTTSTQNSNTEKEKIKEEFKFAALVVQLACIEIKLMLDELSDQLENNKNYEPIERHEIILPACYTILEKSIEYLTKVEYMLDFKKKGEFVDLVGVKLDPELLLRLKSTMIETFRIIMDHLLDIKNFTGSIESNSTLTDKAIASIRILSVWLAEKGSLEKEVITVIPFLFDFVVPV